MQSCLSMTAFIDALDVEINYEQTVPTGTLIDVADAIHTFYDELLKDHSPSDIRQIDRITITIGDLV